MIMDNVTKILDLSFEDAVSAWVRNHHGSQLISELLALFLKFNKVDISLVVTAGDNNFHASHLCACRICSMS